MKKEILSLLIVLCAALSAKAQTYTYTNEDEWAAYDAFNSVFLDRNKYIYRDYSDRVNAVDRWNGAAAIWCQAIYFDMVVNAYNRAVKEGSSGLKYKYKSLFQKIFAGEKSQYSGFNFDNNDTNTGWFVYDDIMWWTCALARAYEAFGSSSYLTLSEKSFLRVWYGSTTVGDDGSYADPERGLGGGMFWEWQPIENPNPHKAGDFRSACINFPTVIAACLLHNNVPESRTAPTSTHPSKQTKEWYLEKAQEIYQWANSTLVKNGRVADGIHGAGPEWKDHLYNQATYIGASCMLYQITGDEKYLNNAMQGANYVFNSMCSSYILPLETGVEQGVYCAIFAQYLHTLVYDLGKTKYLAYVKRNIQKGWTNRDKTRDISNGAFGSATTEGSKIESYTGCALPALMLMFPVDNGTGIEDVELDEKDEVLNDNIYTLDGKQIGKAASFRDVSELNHGLYIYQNKKMQVR